MGELLSARVVSRILVIAPSRPARDVWPCEYANWAIDGYKLVYAGGSGASSRAAGFASDAQVVVINFENVEWAINEGLLAGFDGLVIDELSKLKAVGGSLYKRLRKLVPQFTWRVGLTATPVSEGLRWLYGQVMLLDDGAALGRNQERFLTKWFYPTDFNRRNWSPMPTALGEITQAISGLLYCDEGGYAADLPLLDIEWVPTALPRSARVFYEELSQERVVGEVVCANAGVLVSKQLQICSGFVYDNEGTAIDLHSAKIDAMREGVECDIGQGDNVVIATQFAWEQEQVFKLFPDAVDVREPGAIERWNRGEIAVLHLHPKSGGHGLNIQGGGFRLWIWSPFWSLDLFDQLICRLMRRGQTSDTVYVRVLTCAEGIDNVVREKLRGKLRDQDAFEVVIRE